MFELSKEESNQLINIGVSQSVIPPDYNIGITKIFAFTEQGVAMLSSVLRSKTAIDINISIMRAFVMMRRMITGYEDLKQRIEQLEIETNMQFNDIYQALTELASKKEQEEKPHKTVGYVKPNNNQEL